MQGDTADSTVCVSVRCQDCRGGQEHSGKFTTNMHAHSEQKQKLKTRMHYKHSNKTMNTV